MMIGGAYMILALHSRDFTEDIDYFPLSFDISTQASTQTKAFQSAVRSVAKRHSLKRDWINDTAATMLGGLGPNEPELTLWKQYNHLQIYLPNPEYILAMKLFAGRAKDEEDILVLSEQLGVKTRTQAQNIVNRYIYQRWQIEYKVAKTIAKYF